MSHDDLEDETPRPPPASVPEPQNEPAPDDVLGSVGLSGPEPGAETLAENDPAPGSPAEEATEDRPKSGAPLIMAGILASRVLGLVREKAVAYFFGVGPHLDVYQLLMRGANLLNNLLGEGTLSASFIPIYSRMIEEGRERDAGRFAGAILGLMIAVSATLTLAGVLAAQFVVSVLAPGFLGDAEKVAAGTLGVDRFALAVDLFTYALPMAAFLALSAWALGVLNSHRRFFLPYVAPTLMNIATVAGLIWAATTQFEDPFGLGALEVVPVASLNTLLAAAVIGALVGGFLQFAVQLPLVFRLIKGFRLSVSTKVEGVKEAGKAFGPVVAGRGVAQVSSYVDTVLAGLATAGTLGAIRPALVLYMLPISLFGMSVAASELPELSRISKEKLDEFLHRVDRSTRQMLYLVVPTVVGYLGFGLIIVAAIFGGGAFAAQDTWLVTLILAGYSLGLGATSVSRLLQNSFYALGDTKTPAKIAVARVTVSGLIGAGLMFAFDRVTVAEAIGLEVDGSMLTLAAVGLALGASVGAWIELFLLRWALRREAPSFGLPAGRVARMLGIAGLAAIPAALIVALVPDDALPNVVDALAVIGVYGATYLGLGHVLGFEEGEAWIGRFLRRSKD
ncbi:murein biosynthesis integral membrane protein MurJ [Rubrivirga sp.]|uniref:murein biosynthesis integral membrane protein MurJ n=1 Tax=Rubrivirga sp. TaxID=1885344 RepID=UPI003C7519DC